MGAAPLDGRSGGLAAPREAEAGRAHVLSHRPHRALERLRPIGGERDAHLRGGDQIDHPADFGFGVGIGWAPEEFEWCGVPYAKRGKRVDEMIEVIKLVLAGGMVEFHGEFYDFDRLQMSPAPSEPVPFYVGGHTEVALKRAARIGDGWTSAMMKCTELADTVARINALRAEYGRADVPFEFQAVCIDKFGVDGHRELAEAGVTDNIVIPWIFDGHGFDAPLDKKKDSLQRFADTYIRSGWQD